MLTRCPSCAAWFRVRAEHLSAANGFVTCGQCEQVFSALATLVEEGAPPPILTARAPATSAERAPPAAQSIPAAPEPGADTPVEGASAERTVVAAHAAAEPSLPAAPQAVREVEAVPSPPQAVAADAAGHAPLSAASAEAAPAPSTSWPEGAPPTHTAPDSGAGTAAAPVAGAAALAADAAAPAAGRHETSAAADAGGRDAPPAPAPEPQPAPDAAVITADADAAEPAGAAAYDPGVTAASEAASPADAGTLDEPTPSAAGSHPGTAPPPPALAPVAREGADEGVEKVAPRVPEPAAGGAPESAAETDPGALSSWSLAPPPAPAVDAPGGAAPAAVSEREDDTVPEAPAAEPASAPPPAALPPTGGSGAPAADRAVHAGADPAAPDPAPSDVPPLAAPRASMLSAAEHAILFTAPGSDADDEDDKNDERDPDGRAGSRERAAGGEGATPAPDRDAVPEVLREQLSALRGGRSRTRRVWALTCVGLALLAALQWAVIERTALAAHVPQLAPALDALCARVPCRAAPVEPPARHVQLAARDVREHPQYRDALLVNATLVNAGEVAAAFPVIELRLHDATGSIVGARRFAPEEYLDHSIDIEAGMTPRQPVYLVMELGGAAAAAASFEFTLL